VTSTSRAFDAALDLGTAYVRAITRVGPRVIEHPSVVPVEQPSLSILPGLAAILAPRIPPHAVPSVRPLARGVVVDVEAASRLVTTALGRTPGSWGKKPAVLACVPGDASEPEIEALRAALNLAGAARTTIVPEPMAAAVGAGLDPSLPYAQLVVDVGEGVTDAAIIRLGLMEMARTVRVGCGDLREAVGRRLAEARGRTVSDVEAQRTLESACLTNGQAGGATGHPPAAGRSDDQRAEMRAALEPGLARIIDGVQSIWRELGDEAAAEVVEGGLCLTGGGARLAYVAERLGRATGLDVRVADHPCHAVIRGAGRIAGLR
jgi:rod shape-determining protein MreB and related proteins